MTYTNKSRPFTIYRNRKGWPRWYQRFAEAWWIIRGTWSLHRAWQIGYDAGTAAEYRRIGVCEGRISLPGSPPRKESA